MRPVRVLILALALSACRSTPEQRSPKPAASDTGVPTLVAAVPSASSTALASIDRGFPNEDKPELVTARRLFPTAFGFDEGQPKENVKHLLLQSGHLLEGLADPPPHCLNSVAQPSVADLVLRLLAATNADERERKFSVNEAIVLKDRSRHYVIAVPRGAHGVLMLRPAPSYGIHDDDPTDERFSLVLSDVTIIYPDGHALRLAPGDSMYTGGAILVVTDRLRVRLCANDPRYKAEGCPGSDPRLRIADVPPRDFDLRRCDIGCKSVCSKNEVRQHLCPTPPAPKCVGDKQRIFLDGRDVGGYCVFEEWDIQCAGGCRDDKCVGAPQLNWTRKMAPGFRAVALDAQTMASTEGDDLVTLSVEGEILRREKSAPRGELEGLASDEHGHVFTFDRRNAVVRSHGEGSWSRELDKSAPAFQTWLRYHSDRLYLARGSRVSCLNAASGREEWRLELGAEASSDVVISETSLAVLTVEQEVVVIGLDGSLHGRARLPAEVLERFSLDGETLTVYVKTGEVLSGRVDALKVIGLIPPAEWRPRGVAKLRAGAVLLNRGTDHHGDTRIHALELPGGRELWTFTIRGELQWDPLIDPRGNIVLVGPTITSLTPDGKQRFQIDLRSRPRSEAAATLGPDGTSFYVRTPRALTKFSGL